MKAFLNCISLAALCVVSASQCGFGQTPAPEKPAPAPAAPAGAAQGDPAGGPRGVKTIFTSKEQGELLKKVRDYFDPLDLRKDAQEREGVDSERYKNANKKALAAEKELKNYLKNVLAKNYKLDSECMTAAADWARVFSEYLAIKAEYKKGNTTLGAEQSATLREEPKNPYTRRVPKTYDPAKRAYPLLLVIQDKGKSSKLAFGDELKSAVLLDGEGEALGHIVVVVDIPEALWNDPEKLILAAWKPAVEVRSIFRVDVNRIHIAGLGAGATVAASLAERLKNVFASVTFKGGDPGNTHPDNISNTGVLVVGDASGYAREVVDEAGGKVKWLDRAKSIGIDLTSKEEWKADEFAAFLARRVRDPYPTRVRLAQRIERPVAPAGWIKVEPDRTKDARLDATVDRASNTINIQCDGIARYFLFLSDAVVDLSKPVIIKTNDQERKESLPPSLETLKTCFFDNYRGTDMGQIFTSVPRAIDVPRKKASSADEKK